MKHLKQVMHCFWYGFGVAVKGKCLGLIDRFINFYLKAIHKAALSGI
jgi:hypothetical protein